MQGTGQAAMAGSSVQAGKRANSSPQRGAAGQADTAVDRTAAAYALMARAEGLYKKKHYRQAMAVCAELAALDPTNAMPEQMIEGCRREVRKRRAIAMAIVAAAAIVAATLAAVYTHITRVRILPEPGTIRLHEGRSQTFQVRSPIGYHETLEYRWRLLDADGQPVPSTEQGTLSRHDTTPWERTYLPPYSLVRGGSSQPVVRRIAVTGTDALGREAVKAEWRIEVSDTPLPPRILAVQPRPDDTISIVVAQGAATFRVEAADGDGGADLAYEWLVGGNLAHKGSEAAWTYRPPADALPPGRTGREITWEPPLTLACRVTNRSGAAEAATASWNLRLVRANAPPQLIAFEPELSDLIRIKEGETCAITVKAYDPDEAETLSYRWELDGAVISRGPTATLRFPHETTDGEKRLTLLLTVADSCGAAVTRLWQIVVVDAPPPATPPPY